MTAIQMSPFSCVTFPLHTVFLYLPCSCTVDQTALALFLFRTRLTRQWHAWGQSERADSIRPRPMGARGGGATIQSGQSERVPRATGPVAACPVHVLWNSYCTPGGNVLKRSSRLKKQQPHVFRGLQAIWKSHAALHAFHRAKKATLRGKLAPCPAREPRHSQMSLEGRRVFPNVKKM